MASADDRSDSLDSVIELVEVIGRIKGIDCSWYRRLGGFVNNELYLDGLQCLSVKRGRSFADKFPELALAWHPTKNGVLTPAHVSYGSKFNAWWKCDKGHEWQRGINYCSSKKHNRCPDCFGERVGVGNNLLLSFPDIASQWDVSLNGELSPDKVTRYSHKKVWWRCDNGHNWDEEIGNRTVQHTGCPYCSGRRHSFGHSLAALFPDIAKQLHPKNGIIAENVSFGSGKKMWWRCEKGHEWKTTVGARTIGKTGCPDCYKDRRKGVGL